MIAIALLIIAAKMYAKAANVQDELARSITLSRAESLDALGNKLLKVVTGLIAALWCIYGALLATSALGHPEVLESLSGWLVTTVVVLIIA